MATITQDQINDDFMKLWKMLSDSRVETEYLPRAFKGLVFQIVRYQLQDEAQEDKDRMWTLLETMQIQYDANMGWRAAQDIIDLIKKSHP